MSLWDTTGVRLTTDSDVFCGAQYQAMLELSTEVFYICVERVLDGNVNANGIAAFTLDGDSGSTVTVDIRGVSASPQIELEIMFEIRAALTGILDEHPEEENIQTVDAVGVRDSHQLNCARV